MEMIIFSATAVRYVLTWIAHHGTAVPIHSCGPEIHYIFTTHIRQAHADLLTGMQRRVRAHSIKYDIQAVYHTQMCVHDFTHT